MIMVCNLNDRSIFGVGYSEFMLMGQVAPELGLMVARGLAPMTAAGFLRDLTQEVVEDVENHVLGVDRLCVVVADQSGSGVVPVAFAASDVKEVQDDRGKHVNLLHLGGIIVAPAFQGVGIGRKVIKSELREVGAKIIGGHTANRIMLKEFENVSAYELILANLLFEELGTPEISKKELKGTPYIVHSGRYPVGGLYGDVHKFRKLGMQIDRVDTLNGDAIIYAGRVK